jgi:hypothetical protein
VQLRAQPDEPQRAQTPTLHISLVRSSSRGTCNEYDDISLRFSWMYRPISSRASLQTKS